MAIHDTLGVGLVIPSSIWHVHGFNPSQLSNYVGLVVSNRFRCCSETASDVHLCQFLWPVAITRASVG